jgi:Cu-processing system permease protein
MPNVFAIAIVTLRDALRQKLAVNLLLFALVVIAASTTLSKLTFGEQYRIIADLALSAAALFGTLIAVFLGAGLVAGDVQRRSVYPVLAKPVSRTEYVLGRYAGLAATLLLNLAVMAATTCAALAVYRGSLSFLQSAPLLPAFAGIGIQLLVVSAVAVLFSCFTNATLAAMMTLALTAAGHFTREALPFWQASTAGRLASYVVPNLAALDLKVEVVYERAVAGGAVAAAFAGGLLYAAVCLSLASAIFSARDLR